eukprot:CAMPEP_0179467998 /NCGR_PEP_ID=MMETSP0799-20121207/49008_1 /TAXON_ID=46947 /ORGANISM="Geminigera cryophila, Strain CCMP2564" /LENGTH=80 /DNA_ID=CAMNT_0021273729 /DNA_START=51 /DNA_END=290 /DNA_ORIENTATION=-
MVEEEDDMPELASEDQVLETHETTQVTKEDEERRERRRQKTLNRFSDLLLGDNHSDVDPDPPKDDSDASARDREGESKCR